MKFKDPLCNFRNQINNIDENIVQLLAERKILTLKIAQSKIKNNQAIRDIEREKKILQKLITIGKKNHLEPDYITQLFQLIIEESVLIQQKILEKFCNNNKLTLSSFSLLGPKGSYSHIAACQYAKKNFQKCIIKECSTFEEVILSVENNKSDYAILPIENTCSGFINDILDILKRTSLVIIGEINTVINHCLVAIEKIEIHEIKTIYSHPQPFQQCSNFIQKFPNWKIKYTKSTADAMKKITKYKIRTNAALGSEMGSKIYGLNILSTNLTNKDKNMTRFIILNKKPINVPPKIPTKTTLIFSTGQESGALSKVLSIFKEKKIIVRKLTSKTINKNPSKEMFYIEIEANTSSQLMKNVLLEMQKITNFIKILGCYPIENISRILQ